MRKLTKHNVESLGIKVVAKGLEVPTILSHSAKCKLHTPSTSAQWARNRRAALGDASSTFFHVAKLSADIYFSGGRPHAHRQCGGGGPRGGCAYMPVGTHPISSWWELVALLLCRTWHGKGLGGVSRQLRFARSSSIVGKSMYGGFPFL
jgi:hypothetical protein